MVINRKISEDLNIVLLKSSLSIQYNRYLIFAKYLGV